MTYRLLLLTRVMWLINLPSVIRYIVYIHIYIYIYTVYTIYDKLFGEGGHWCTPKSTLPRSDRELAMVLLSSRYNYQVSL